MPYYKPILSYALLSFSLLAYNSHADIHVIVNKNAPFDTLTQKQCIDIFMGKSRKFEDGQKIEAIDQNKESPIRADFYTKLTGKSLTFVNAYWARLFYTGRVQPPKDSFANSEEIIQEVAKNMGAIAYRNIWLTQKHA